MFRRPVLVGDMKVGTICFTLPAWISMHGRNFVRCMAGKGRFER
jgi:hypothetical protein